MADPEGQEEDMAEAERDTTEVHRELVSEGSSASMSMLQLESLTIHRAISLGRRTEGDLNKETSEGFKFDDSSLVTSRHGHQGPPHQGDFGAGFGGGGNAFGGGGAFGSGHEPHQGGMGPGAGMNDMGGNSNMGMGGFQQQGFGQTNMGGGPFGGQMGHTTVALIAYARDSRYAHFNLTMWSGAYPIGIFGIACNQIGVDLDSPAFKGIASAILIIAVIHWIWLVIYTIPMIVSGELFLAEAEHLSKEEAEAEKKMSHGEAAGQETPDGQVERRNNRSRSSADDTHV
ncbi:hypothetical protein QFC21_000791 [Naganishia friedmannii]|uniref:Uncharacterized protein n=1 Tax=Naganishia friedmannii TaxID=89922 RepID=A0ACC2W8G2_9TREE|nr:hypothetical protein QFC21_000791 [Naganishia friedmannii]